MSAVQRTQDMAIDAKWRKKFTREIEWEEMAL